MPRTDTLAKGAAALALGFAVLTFAPFTGSALADSQDLYGVADIDILATPPGPQLVVRNTAANHHVDSLHLAVQGSTIAVAVGGYVECTGTQLENLAQRQGHYLSSAAYGIGRTSLLVGKTLPASQSIDHTGDMDSDTFQLPVAKLADPQIAVDPVAVVLAAADKAPDRLAWLRQDHTLTVKIPLRWEAGCAWYSRNKITKNTIREAAQPSFLTKDVELKIKYQGDSQLFAVNAQIAQGGLPNQVQVGDQPFKITSMTFQPNMPHHVGACPATTTIRVFFQGQGKGEVRIRINESGTTIHNSPVVAFDSKNGKHHYDFEIATPKAVPSDLNKTVNHDLRLFVRGKGDEEQTWPGNYQPMDQAFWKHRCTPVVNPALGGGVGGQAPGYQGSGGGSPNAAPSLRLQPPVPAPRPARKTP